MDAERWVRLRELFDAAMDLQASERPDFIARSCGEDHALRENLESLLRHSLEKGFDFDRVAKETVDIESAIPTSWNLVGQTLDRYRIIDKIGEGGMGEVYRATDTRLGRDVAIKILPEDFTRDPERLARFEREAQVLASLNHPNIATILGVEQKGDIRYLVLEFVDGETLGSRLGKGPLSIKTVLRLATQAAEGLAKAHEAGIVHRDLKPDNLMLTSDGFVKILDFGLAKTDMTTYGSGSVMPTHPALDTGTGRIMGTTNYMSPEQARGEGVDHRSDQFAFGSVLYEMVTGVRAFQRPTYADTLVAIMREDPELPDDFDTRAPKRVRWIIERCLAKEPEDRYDSTRDLARDLRDLSERLSETDRSRHAAARPSKRGMGAVVAACLGLVTIAAAAWWWQSRGTTGHELAARGGVTSSIAVLPLENMGPAEQEYFADGMTDALITHLSKIKALKVISRTTVMRYKGSRESLPEIAGELGVETVLTGSVLHAGGRVRISTQLTDATADHNLWAESYEQDLHDILVLQGELARAIAGAVRVEIDPEVEGRMTTSRTIDREAHDEYLKGLAELRKASAGSPHLRNDLGAGVEHFRRAIEIEPDWAEPQVGLARAYFWLASIGGPDVQWAFYPKAKSTALRALELDETVAEAHVILGTVQLYHEWDWAGAERSFERAFELDPNNTSWGYGQFLKFAGRYDEAIAYHKKAQERSPISLLPSASLGWTYFYAGRAEEAEQVARQIIAAVPESPAGYSLLGSVLLMTSRYDEAVAVLEGVWDESIASSPWLAGRLPVALAKAGRVEEARQMLHELEAAGLDWFPESYWVLGEDDKAMAQIEAAFAARRDVLLLLRYSEDCMEHSRCRETLKAIGFPNLEYPTVTQ
jgi:serine/threonine-protein kinase